MSEQTGEGPESYNGYSVDDEDQPQSFGDSLVDNRGLREPLDEGYSPPDHWSYGQGFGNTAFEEARGETLAQRLAQEEPEPDPYASALGESAEGTRVGGTRAGHLVAYDPGPADQILERGTSLQETDDSRTPAGEEPSWARQVGGPRSGRLLSYDEGVGEDDVNDLVAFDIGIDGAGASAEEAAMHLIEDESWSDGP